MFVAVILAACLVAPTSDDWTHFAHGPTRVARASASPDSIADPTWVCSTDDLGRPITFVGQSSVVGDDGAVYAVGTSGGQAKVHAINTATGTTIWSTIIPDPVSDSWATPALDVEHETVLVASGTQLCAYDTATGQLVWVAQLDGSLINASPLVTTDLGPADRAFITDSSGFFTGGKLYCVNVDAQNEADNPYEPGDVVWSVDLSQTSGNTPAYRDGIVYVTTAEQPGRIIAFPADATSSPMPIWEYVNTSPHGFYGGPCVTSDDCDVHLYAASYGFYGGQFSGNLVKINAATGEEIWSVPANRTDVIPIPLGDGRIALSGGLDGFGAVPSIQLFCDEGASASLLWDSALDTWVDANQNGVMDPGEFLSVGGWTNQPAVAALTARPVLYAGTLPDPPDFSGQCTDLYALAMDLPPDDPAFIIEHFTGAGSSPAISDGTLYSLGPAGLYAFSTTCPADFNGDGKINSKDFIAFLNAFVAGDPSADFNNDGLVNSKDFIIFLNAFVAGC